MSTAESDPWSWASAPIWEMTSGYAASVRAQKVLVALQAYVDDSASDRSDDRKLFLAGYINTADKWARFSDVWAEELARSPSIDYLKMSEANCLGGQFRGWDAPDRDAKLNSLARLIRHFQPASIHSSVSRTEVKAIMEGVVPYGFANPYFYCFQAIMIPLAYSQHERGGMDVPVDFIFDEQEGLGEEARFFYRHIRQGQPRSIQKLLAVEPIFKNDKRVLPLQAADMLAWHVRRSHERDPRKFWVPELLSHDGLHMATDIDADRLRHMAEEMSKIPGTAALRKRSEWRKVRKAMTEQARRGELPSMRVSRWKNTLLYAGRRAKRLLYSALSAFGREDGSNGV